MYMSCHLIWISSNSLAGPGGSLMAALCWLQTIYNQSLFRKRVLFIPAGGFSQRLPSASLLGKIFTAVPYGSPIYQMLELNMAMYIDLPAHMDSGGIFLACADTIILYDCSVGLDWSFNHRGITAFGHPAPIATGTTHGVFRLPDDKHKVCSHVHVVECEEFLHKRSADVLREKGALLGPACRETLGINEDYVVIDSSYFMDGETAKKLIDFYEERSPLTCEIDSHGDFLHGLGSRGSNTYITDMSNVTQKTSGLLQMRQEIFNLLRGTPLQVLVLPHSKFYHIGTTQELLHHYCDNASLAMELGVTRDAFNRSFALNDEQPVVSTPRKACIMNSIVPSGIDTSQRCVVEYCQMKTPCVLSERCILSNCAIEASTQLTIPPNTFLHTAAVKMGGNCTSFVTVFFDIRDNLKRSVEPAASHQLSFLHTSFQELFGYSASTILHTVFPQGTPCSIWHAKLFPTRPTMEESFLVAMTFLDTALGRRDLAPLVAHEQCLSLADVMQLKNIEAMLEFRKQLYSLIIEGWSVC